MPSFRLIPSIDTLLGRPRVAALVARYGHGPVVAAARRAADAWRADGEPPGATADAAAAWIEDRAAADLAALAAPSLRPVINATGVIVHTNLGRAPLAAAAIDRIAAVAGGYSNLEYDVAAGRRGQRDAHARRLLAALTGADAAVVVNNNAGATLVALAALAAGREVIVSRGELVEIGGGFRVPDVMAQSGAVLREVGTTNRTRAADYAAAIGDRTALILRVHPSNFRIEGFTERPALEDLIAIGRRFDLPVFEDLGSGWLAPDETTAPPALRDEPDIRASIAAGVDLVAVSGDKLLGGPQAGLLLGRPDLVERVRQHPLMRALRADKLTYAALEATLELWLREPARGEIPVFRMLTMDVDEIDRRARALAARLAGLPNLEVDIIDGVSTTGGGSAPGSALPTRLVALSPRGGSAAALDAALRAGDPPIVARIDHEQVLIDLRTVRENEDDLVAHRIGTAAAGLKTDGR